MVKKEENFEDKINSLEIDKHKHLQDIRSFNEYMNNVVKYGLKEKEYFDIFIKLLVKMDFDVMEIKDKGCDKDKEFGVCLFSNEVNDVPDFEFVINSHNILLEVKNSKYDLKKFHLKKFQIDNYVKINSVHILWIMDCNKKPHFTILNPKNIVKSKVWLNPKFGNKEVYVLHKKDYKWFYFNVSNELKKFICEKFNI